MQRDFNQAGLEAIDQRVIMFMPNKIITKILIVDDHEFIRESLSLTLQRLGNIQCFTASNGEEALTQFILTEDQHIDLIFFDLNMPVLDGLEFMRRLNEVNYKGASVLITGEESEIIESAKTLANNYGLWIVDFIQKPVTVKDCSTILEKIAKRRKEKGALEIEELSEAELQTALDEKHLAVYLQPQIDISSREVRGFEALVRINHPDYGLLIPKYFLPVAESGELIHPLTTFVIKESLKWCKNIQQSGYDTTISINLSARVLEKKEFPLQLKECVREANLSPASVICELTEGLLVKNETQLLETMTRLRMNKFRLSVDDFGTGFASLEQLQRLPFHELKIDQCFVKNFLTNNKSRSIVENSQRLATDLNLTTVAEGVETEACLLRLGELGCDTAQGYYIARPMPAEQTCDWLENYTPTH